MTHTDISELAEERRSELTGQSRFSAVVDCLTIQSANTPENQDDLLQWFGDQNSSLGPVKYFQESTIAKHADPVERANNVLENGIKVAANTRIDLNSPPIWDELKSESRNIRYKLHSWVLLDPLLCADQVAEGNEYLEMAINIANDWIEHFIIAGEKDEFAWYDMGVGQRATKLPYMLRRLIEIGGDSEIISNFIIASEIHISELSQEERVAMHSNHGLFQIAGLMALVRDIPWLSGSESGFESAMELLKKMIDEHFADDGLHKEHSPEYHLFMRNHLHSFQSTGWLDSDDEISRLLTAVDDISHWMQNPEKKVIALGDSNNGLTSKSRWNEINEQLTPGLKILPFGGLVIENTENGGLFSQLVFSAQFHSRQHKHADNLNVLYHLNEKPLLVDSGSFTYQYDLPERIYCESTRAHNTVEIDGLNHSRFRQDAFGSALSFCTSMGPCTIMRGSIQHSRLISSFIPNNKIQTRDGVKVDIKQDRTIIHYPNRFLAIIDQIQSPECHDYIQWHHFPPEINIREYSAQRYELINSDDEKVCRVFSSDTESNPMKPTIVRGQTQPHLQGWISHDGVELIENTALGYNYKGDDASFVTVFDFSMKNTGKPYLREGSGGKYLRFALTQDGSKVDVKIRIKSDGTRNVESIIDGEEFIVELGPGVICDEEIR